MHALRLFCNFFLFIFPDAHYKYYIGSTGDLIDRLNKHNRSNKGFTSTGKPWIIVYHESFHSRKEALIREKQLKSWKNRDRIESLISNRQGHLHE